MKGDGASALQAGEQSGGGASLRSETQACRPVLGFRDGEAELPVARSAGGVS